MKHLARIILTLAVLSLLAAVWAPGPWWSWLLTAVILLFVGAGLSGSNHPDGPHPIDRGLLPEDVAREFVEPSTDTEQDIEEERYVITTGPFGTRSRRLPTYGKPAQKGDDDE